MIHCVSDRIDFSRRVKESKRAYLNLKSNENLVTEYSFFTECFLKEINPVEFLKYPVFDEIYSAFRSHLGVDSLLLTAGCHDAIRVIASSLDKENNKVLLTTPNYDGYALYLDINEIPCVTSLRTPESQHDLSAIQRLARVEKCNIIVLTNPDPFVGDCFEHDQIHDFVASCQRDGITVVLDEVYTGFGRESDVLLTRAFDNLIILNSLSKSYGLPGARVGWIAASEKNIENLACQFPESTISGFSLALCKQLLDTPQLYEDYRKLIVGNRASMVPQLLEADGVSPFVNSVTNFIMFKATREDRPSQLWEEMLENGIYLANLSHLDGFESYYRATVCADKDRGSLIESIKQL